MFVFVVYFIPFRRMILVLIQGCLSLILAVLCGMNLFMALSSSDVM